MGGCNNGRNSGHQDASHSATSSLWYVGVIVSVVGSICTNMGVNLQKYSFMNEAKRAIKLKRGYLRQPFWVIGTSLFSAREIAAWSCWFCGVSQALLL